MHDVEYVLCTKFVDVCMMWKKKKICFKIFHHNIKLVILLRFINIALAILFQIIKCLWVCEGCHISTKFITKIVGRIIMVRDANHFHHFEDGVGYCVLLIATSSSFYFQHIYWYYYTTIVGHFYWMWYH
jgi:hypothetical protein